MIAADTSVWISYFEGKSTEQSLVLENTLRDGAIVMPHPVLFELLSGPGMDEATADLLKKLPCLELTGEYWHRAGDMRRQMLKSGRKARAMDCLIAQNCIDHDVSLMTTDADFRPFTQYGLRIVDPGKRH